LGAPSSRSDVRVMRKSDNPGNPSSPHRGGVDRFSGALTAVLFSVAMGIASVAVPLLAVSAGHSAAQVGVVIASSAVAQMVTRPFLGLLMRRPPDKVLVLASAGFMAVSCALVGLSEARGPRLEIRRRSPDSGKPSSRRMAPRPRRDQKVRHVGALRRRSRRGMPARAQCLNRRGSRSEVTGTCVAVLRVRRTEVM